jgi:hypothetical protein
LKLLSYQSFSLYANGGGNRILRRLYQGREQDVISLVAEQARVSSGNGTITETVVYAEPVVQKWARWHIRTFITWLRQKMFRSLTISKVQKAAAKLSFDKIHVVDHGPFSAALCDDAKFDAYELWVSFHDHFNTTHGSFENTAKLWVRAARCLVISAELGNQYQTLFGQKPYEIITDGVKKDELTAPATTSNEVLTIYFAGLLHIDYIPLFEVLANTLDALSKQGHKFKIVLRGTQHLPFLDNRSFEIHYRPTTLDNFELKAELDQSDILYLPIKFTKPDFYLYSLSTKMVGYLGGSGAILYHGPADSAACHLLQQANAAVCCGELSEAVLSKDILKLIADKSVFSANAKKLASQQFDMDQIQSRFWQQS